MIATRNTYDVAVIGGGPAGMMAAAQASERGLRVVLLEKNPTLGKKLLLTGGGRCNVTNAEFDVHIFLKKFGDASKFLFSPFSKFGVQETLEFFHTRGMSTKIEAENRVFPVSDTSQSVLDVLQSALRAGGVRVIQNTEIDGFELSNGTITGILRKHGSTLFAHSYILATGGKSRPDTGSTGDGFLWLKAIGHTIVPPRPALVPVCTREHWTHKLSGVSFTDAKLTVFQGGEKKFSKRGKLLLTHFGLSGPLALNMSREISGLLLHGNVTVSIDCMPNIESEEVDKRLCEHLNAHMNKRIKNALHGFVQPRMLLPLLSLTHIDPDTPVCILTRKERLLFVQIVKGFSLTVSGVLSEDNAVVTSGGVALPEVDFAHMRSRLFPNLYFAGDILNIDRPSGGFSLQLCWTTGFVAGDSAAEQCHMK